MTGRPRRGVNAEVRASGRRAGHWACAGRGDEAGMGQPVLSLFEEADGWRYTAFVTNTKSGTLQWLEARHRAHARVEDRIRCAKDTGLGRLPSREFAINQAWCTTAAIAVDLIAWLQILALTKGLATAEPKRLRYRILHTAARLTRGQRHRWLRIPASWPWAEHITTAYHRIAAIPAPG
jgi:hypothetical protein